MLGLGCAVRKLVRTNFRRTVKEYFALYRSRKSMVTKLTQAQIEYAIKQRKNGKSAHAIASELKVSKRRIEQLYAEFCKTGTEHVLLKPGRKN